MENGANAAVEQELADCAMEVVRLQKAVFELEQQREGPTPPPDLEEQIQKRSDELKDAQERHAALKAAAASE